MNIKKIGAVIGTAILASSMTAPVMATTLADLPTPFVTEGVFDANIVVGSVGSAAGIASDLAGALDVAAAFAQQAVTTITNTVNETRILTPGRLNSSVGYLGFGDTAISQTFNGSTQGFEWMINNTIDDYTIVESIQTSKGNDVTLSNDALLKIDFNGLVYKLESNKTFSNGITLPIFGDDYKVVSTSSDKLTFGTIEKLEQVTIPTSIDLNGKATLDIVDYSILGDKEALVKVTDVNGTVMFDGFMPNDGSKTFEGYTFSLSDLRVLSSGTSTINVEFATSSFELNNNGNGSAISSELDDWKVNVGTDFLSFTSPRYTLTTTPITLGVGEEISIMNHFDIKYDGLTNVNSSDISVSNIIDEILNPTITYVNALNDTNTMISLNSYSNLGFDSNGLTDYVRLLTDENVFRFKVGQNDSDRFVEVYLEDDVLGTPSFMLYNTTETNHTTFDVQGATYDVDFSDTYINFSLASFNAPVELIPKYSLGLVYDGSVKLTENSGNVITLTYENESIKGTDGFSDFGSFVSSYDDHVGVSLVENRMTSNIWIGRSSEEVVNSTTTTTTVINPITGTIGMSDSEFGEDVVLSKPTIIVGGGLANALTNEVESTVSTSDLLNATDRAYLELIDNAFGGTETVLIIAGRNAKDTRLACQVLAAEISGLVELGLDGSISWLDTSVEDFSLVKVVE